VLVRSDMDTTCDLA